MSEQEEQKRSRNLHEESRRKKQKINGLSTTEQDTGLSDVEGTSFNFWLSAASRANGANHDDDDLAAEDRKKPSGFAGLFDDEYEDDEDDDDLAVENRKKPPGFAGLFDDENDDGGDEDEDDDDETYTESDDQVNTKEDRAVLPTHAAFDPNWDIPIISPHYAKQARDCAGYKKFQTAISECTHMFQIWGDATFQAIKQNIGPKPRFLRFECDTTKAAQWTVILDEKKIRKLCKEQFYRLRKRLASSQELVSIDSAPPARGRVQQTHRDRVASSSNGGSIQEPEPTRSFTASASSFKVRVYGTTGVKLTCKVRIKVPNTMVKLEYVRSVVHKKLVAIRRMDTKTDWKFYTPSGIYVHENEERRWSVRGYCKEASTPEHISIRIFNKAS